MKNTTLLIWIRESSEIQWIFTDLNLDFTQPNLP